MAHSVSETESRDPLARMRVYQLAAQILQEAWSDVERLKSNDITTKSASQLYAAIGSIAANLAEGYSRSSGKARANAFEYALGSTRESMIWYRAAIPVLGVARVQTKLDTLEEIRRMLLAIIPRERGRLIRPNKT